MITSLPGQHPLGNTHNFRSSTASSLMIEGLQDPPADAAAGDDADERTDGDGLWPAAPLPLLPLHQLASHHVLEDEASERHAAAETEPRHSADLALLGAAQGHRGQACQHQVSARQQAKPGRQRSADAARLFALAIGTSSTSSVITSTPARSTLAARWTPTRRSCLR